MVTANLLTEEELLYSYNSSRKSFQWGLWDECNNACSFCILGSGRKNTPRERKLKSLLDLKQAIKGLDFSVYNNISLIGGEIFQGQLEDEEIREQFFDVIKMCGNLYNHQKIGSMWITATLTIGDQSDLYTTFQILDDLNFRPNPKYSESGLTVCTSWDKDGRFHVPEREKNWRNHMKRIRHDYPWVKLNTSIILTQEMCEMYIAGNFKPKEFMEKFGTHIEFSVPRIFDLEKDSYQSLLLCKQLNETGELHTKIREYKKNIEKQLNFRFFPDRKTFRNFLLTFAKRDPELYDFCLFNIDRTADEYYKNFNGIDEAITNMRVRENDINACSLTDIIINDYCSSQEPHQKHSIAYEGYIDCNSCMACDKELIKDAAGLR